MLNNKYKRSLLSIFILLYLNSSAQNFQANNVRSLTVDNGLPQGFITGMLQDKQGFIWLSTSDGLARYDGKNIKVFYHDNADGNSLSTNVIRHLFIDKENDIWIQHDNGATDVLNPLTEKFRHLTNEKDFAWLKPESIAPYRIFEDDTHHIYVIAFNKKLLKNEFICFTWEHTKPEKILFPDNEYPAFITEDNNGQTWVSTDKALYKSENYHSFKKVCDLPAEIAARLSAVNGASPDGDLRLTKEGGLLLNDVSFFWLYNFQTRQWKKFELPLYITDASKKEIEIAPDGTFYLAVKNKMYKINKDGSLSLLWINELKPADFWTIIDRSNVLWVATNTFGARMIDLNNSGFNSVKIKNGFFYDVLPQYYKMTVYNSYTSKPKFNDQGYDGRSCFDNNGNLWLINFLYENMDGQKADVNSFIKIANQRPYVYNIESKLPVTPENKILNFAFDAQNRCWALFQNNKLAEVDLEKKQFLNAVTLNSDNQTANYLLAVNNNLWVIYPDALECFNPTTKKIIWYKDDAFRNAYLLMAASDPKNKNLLWLASRGNGLIKFDITTAIAKSFTTKEGLPNNTVYTIAADKDGYFWCSSNNGIFRFSPADYSVLSFTVKDGLQGNEFNRFQFVHFPDNKIAFGGTEGYTMFDPDSINIDNYEPNIALTDIAINNEPVAKYSAWKNKAVVAIDTMHLSYNQNFLTFHFAAMEYNDPEKLHYRYMLTGVDKSWVNAGNQNSANYTNLFPGTYTFKINASNTAGLWSNQIKTIHIVIASPWWKTWWAYTLYATIIVALIFLFFSYRLKQIKAKQQISLQQKEAEQLRAMDELKSRFFSNITHEFRTPLSLIISPVEQMQRDENASPLIKKNLSLVQRNAKQLLRLINQLLDMSKIESGNMKLSLSRGDIKLFAEECVQTFTQNAERKKINLELNIINTGEEYLFDTDKLEKIFYNLISNAIKFTPENGSIRIFVSVDVNKDFTNTLRLQVTDTGIGIDEEKLPHIFNRFYQVDNSATRKYEGTGIGLALVKELVQLMNGKIEAESKLREGTTFNVFLPVQKATGEQMPQLSKIVSLSDIAAVSEPLAQPHTNGKNNSPLILVVEDNEELRAFIAQSLQKNYRTITAANGKEAITVATEELPDVIISDVMMPEMDGYALCKKIKTNIVTEHIAVVLLTAKTAHESVIEGLTCGADDYITKPFHLDELQLRIHNILERQEKLRIFFQSQLSNPVAPIDKKEIENAFMKQLYIIIDEHLDDTTLSVEKLATKAAVSHRTLNRKLSSLIGLSASELIKQYRLKRSIEFLKAGSNVSETAYSVGFETHSHFTTSFKAFFGVTPTEYQHQKQ